jgi:hypothetical protein
MKQFSSLVFIILFAIIPNYSQVTIEVPADYSTIQAAIDAATNGDLVLVSEGTYYENINFMGKAITVASKYFIDGKEKHIKKTIINGSQPINPDFGSVVNFVSGEDTNSVLCGFTITGGTGTLEMFPGNPPIREGGGIYCLASGAKIIHNIIKNNKSEMGNAGMSWGGGFASTPPWVPMYVILENNVFENNSVTGSIMCGGGGVSFSCSGRIVKNTFTHNTIYAEDGSAGGGGLIVQSWSPPTPPNEVFMSDNIIIHNKALQSESATFWLGGLAGGVSILGSKGVYINNIIQHNEVNAVNSSYGAGVVFDYPPDDLYFRNNIVSHNTYSGAGYCYGGGFAVWDGSPTIENNLFEKNKATFGGGGWIGDAFSFTKIINNTIIKNHAEQKGGALYTKSAAPIVMNSILWNNHAPEGSEIYVESGTIDVTYSDVMGGWTGTGNINANPKLISNYSLLQHSSPCIDAGNPDAIYFDPEDPFHTGYAMYPARGLVRNDIGAYGGPGAINWYGFLGKTNFDDEELATSELTSNKIRIDNYPNPFNPSTKINYTLPRAANVTLQVFDVLGNEIETLVNESKQPGNYEVEFNGIGLASGMYLYRIQVIPSTGSGETFVETKKMLLLK